MKPTELRIRNLVLYAGMQLYVSEIDRHGNIKLSSLIEETDTSIENCSGIPLTEEWLLKAGFEKDIDLYYTHKDFDSGIYFKIGTERSIYGDFDECVYIRLPKYLHQIQNLYFAIIGTELEIKL